MTHAGIEPWVRTLARPRSRRGALNSALGGAIALLGLGEAQARPSRRKHKKRRGSSASPPAPPPPASSCTHGDATDVGCGGSCPPCATGQRCHGHADCASALCVDGTCTECQWPGTPCDTSGSALCQCVSTPSGNRCVQPASTTVWCADCPAGTVTCQSFPIEPLGLGSVCYALCGT